MIKTARMELVNDQDEVKLMNGETGSMKKQLTADFDRRFKFYEDRLLHEYFTCNFTQNRDVFFFDLHGATT